MQATFRAICATVAAMTPEQERWAEALAIDRQFGGEAARHVAERIGALALAGDLAGVARWRQIAARLDQMMRGAPVHPKDMSDEDLVAAYERTTGQRGDRDASALLAEIRRRKLDL